jgi:hypothetical protein
MVPRGQGTLTLIGGHNDRLCGKRYFSETACRQSYDLKCSPEQTSDEADLIQEEIVYSPFCADHEDTWDCELEKLVAAARV